MFVGSTTRSRRAVGNYYLTVGGLIKISILAASFVTLAVGMMMPPLHGLENVTIEKVSATLSYVAAENKKSKNL